MLSDISLCTCMYVCVHIYICMCACIYVCKYVYARMRLYYACCFLTYPYAHNVFWGCLFCGGDYKNMPCFGTAIWCCLMWLYLTLFKWSHINRHLNCFQYLHNKQYHDKHDLHKSLGGWTVAIWEQIPGRGIADRKDIHTFNLGVQCQTRVVVTALY